MTKEEFKRQVHIQCLITDAEMLGIDLSDYSREEIAELTHDDLQEMALLNVEPK